MDKADVALIISALSAGIALFTLGWNIYRDIVLRPRLKITFFIGDTTPSPDARPNFVVISGTNFGPGITTVRMVHTRKTSLWRRLRNKVINGIVLTQGAVLPKRLEVGESVQILFPYDKDCFLKEDWNRVGLCDTFNKTHWATPNSVKNARKKWIDNFGHNTKW